MLKQFKEYLVAISVTVAGVLVPASQVHAGKSLPVIPVRGERVSIFVNGKEKSYYLLSKNSSLKVEVDGPGKLIIFSRLRLPAASANWEKYTVKVVEAGKELKTYTTQTERSDASYKNSDFIPAKMRKFTLEIPQGSHTYDLLLENTSATEAAMRFNIITSTRRNLVTLEPLSYDRVVTALAGEKLITYYVSSKDRKVQLRVVGPVRLEITTRLNFDAKMTGEQRYTLSVWEGEKRLVLRPLATTKALGVAYQEWKDVVPGKANAIYYEVPQGEHRYRFNLEETIAHSVSLKFSIPQQDLRNEK